MATATVIGMQTEKINRRDLYEELDTRLRNYLKNQTSQTYADVCEIIRFIGTIKAYEKFDQKFLNKIGENFRRFAIKPQKEPAENVESPTEAPELLEPPTEDAKKTYCS